MDDSGLGWKLFGGYNFNQYFGAEFAYVDLGEVEAGVSRDQARKNGIALDAVNISGAIEGYTLAGVVRYPVSRQFEIFAKAGAFSWRVDANLDQGFFDGRRTYERGSPSYKGISYVFGFGAEYDITENLSLRAEWERYGYDFDKDKIKKTDGDVDFFSAAVVYAF